MVSFNENGRGRKPGRRDKAAKRPKAVLRMEALEDRQLLADLSTLAVNPLREAWKPTSNDVSDIKRGPLAPAGALVPLYLEYQNFVEAGGNGNNFRYSQTFRNGNRPGEVKSAILTRGDMVGVDVRGTGDFRTFKNALVNLGMQVTAENAAKGIVEGFLPIAQIPTAVRIPQTVGIDPIYQPFTRQLGTSPNEADRALRTDVARTTYGVDGTGIMVGVLSDSVNLYDNPAVAGVGLAESYTTQDLVAGSVQVLLDDQSGSNSDEGRAMIEQIADMAPGARFAFHTAFGGPVLFANGIRALAQAGSKVIVDDVGNLAEPFFQDGDIDDAIRDVVTNFGVSYFAAAGNSSDSGYLSNFRGASGTVTGIGTGRFMDFDPGPGVSLSIPVTPRAAGGPLVLQWDNPVNNVSSDLDLYVLDANGAVIAVSNFNNVAIQGVPMEVVGLPANAASVVVQVASGADPGNIVIVDPFSDGVAFSRQFGSAGNTYYPSVYGHTGSAQYSINVAATPWWAAPPFTTGATIPSESFSSFGPALRVFDFNGNRLASPVLHQTPQISATDGNNTSFFIPGFDIDTTNPPFPPAIGTNLDPDSLPNFFGTSAAAPNAAAVAALMKQLNPSATRNDILNAMITSTLPVNGATKGQWNAQGGYGLIQADAALASIDTLRVVTTTPANGTNLNTFPSSVIVTFSRAINPATVQASDLVFTSLPAGVTARVLAPVQLNATTYSFPLDIQTAAGVKANGTYSYQFNAGSIQSTDSRPLAVFSAGFTIADTISPKITNVSFLGRQVVIQFSEAMRASLINRDTVEMFYLSPQGFVRLNDLGPLEVRYDAATNRAIVDLSKMLQQDLKSGTYTLGVLNVVSDLAGNRLDGEFFGRPGVGQTFPSGDNKPLPLEDTDNDNFLMLLSNVTLTAPQVTTVGIDQTAGNLGNNPRILGTLFNRQRIEIQFSEPMDPAWISKSTIELYRQVPAGFDPLNRFAGLTVTYDAPTNKAIIDISSLSEADLPSDGKYIIGILDLVRDTQGNRLDGEFPTGVTPLTRNTLFPSGDGKPVQIENADNDGFLQILPTLDTSGPSVFVRYDSGIAGDQNTNVTRPRITGKVITGFPGTVAGLTVVAQFNALHNGTFDLTQGPGGRGFSGSFDVATTTDADGNFSFQAPAHLRDGQHTVRIIIVGDSDQPPLPGLSTRIDQSFRIDTTKPQVKSSIVSNSQLSSLTSLSLDIVDPVEPTSPFDPLVVSTQRAFPALDPTTANNISNYSLVNLGSDGLVGGVGSAADVDFSSYIIGANFVSTSNRLVPSDPYTGRVDLTFATGLPRGKYMVIARRPQPGFQGITDAAGNPIDGDLTRDGAQDFKLIVDLQPTAAYITKVAAVSPIDDLTPINPSNPDTYRLSDPRSYFELAVPGTTPRAVAPPKMFFIDFSNPLDPNRDYSNVIQLFRSANNVNGALPDGDFGLDPTFSNQGPGAAYTRVTNLQIELVSGDVTGVFNRLRVTLPAGVTLAADTYRLYIPNTGTTEIVDVFGNQLDGEFLGDQTGPGTFETLLPNGQYRAGLSGDAIPGGAFTTGYIVVANGNVIFARPDYVFDPGIPDTIPDGSAAKPFPTLAPEADPSRTALHGGDLNSTVNAGLNFDSRFDYNRNGDFDPSAFYAAQVASANGPVVIVALPGTRQFDPATGATTQKTFVLASPSGIDPQTGLPREGSASVPFNTTLSFQSGSALKLQNASLYVQNQGSALQATGGFNAEDRVTFTSFSDDSVGGDTNGDGLNGDGGLAEQGGRDPQGADWGGLIFRNFTQLGRTNRVPFPVDSRLKGPDGTDARSGADEALSFVNFARIRFGGGPVPQSLGSSNGPITLYNTRLTLTNTTISDSSVTGAGVPVSGTVGAITTDFDSFREDELARGPLIRRVDVVNNSMNAIFIRAELSGQARQTNAIDYPDLVGRGGSRNFAIDDPLPHVLTTRLVIGEEEQVLTGGTTLSTTNRLYIQPGMMFKMPTGTAIDLLTPGSSINIGDRTYIKQFDADPSFSPDRPNGTDGIAGTRDDFRNNTTGDAKVIFTSFFDDDATTVFRDPNTGQATTIVPAIDTDSGGRVFLPTPGNPQDRGRWGGIKITAGAVGVIDEAEFRYGGGSVNVPTGTIGQRDVIALEDAFGFVTNYDGVNKTTVGALGSTVKITNNDFYDNNEAPLSVNANGLLAADPLRPLTSGNPYFRGNVMLRNDVNAFEVIPVPQNRGGSSVFGYPSNLEVDSVWDDTDVVWALRTTIVLAGASGFGDFPSANPQAFTAQMKPFVSLTLQSNLGDKLLADGSRIARPGETLVVKLLNDLTVPPIGDGINGMPTGNQFSDSRGGAGFLVGIDDGQDGDPDGGVVNDPGIYSQLRIVGIGSNESTGQQRVPVQITSMRDDTIGKTVRGVDMFQAISGNTTAPAAGDGGVIGFGANMLTDYNLYDPRDGSIIDNADIRYITRIEQQGGGVVDLGTGGIAASKLGLTPETQFNSAKAMTLSNSNFSNFSQVGFIAHDSGANALLRDPQGGIPIRTLNGVSGRGQPTLTFFYNNVFANMPVGARIVSMNVNNTEAARPAEAIFLNNTFYNNPIGLDIQGAADNGQNRLSHVHFLAMDNIFDSSLTAAIQTTNMVWGGQDGSQAQFNLYSNSGTNPIISTGAWSGFPNANPIFGNARFRNPAALDFTLLAGSDAVDAGLSELGQVNLGRSLLPISNQLLNASGGVRNTTGRTVAQGALAPFAQPGDVVTLPGFPSRTFEDQFVAVLPGTLGAVAGPSNVAGTNWYLPINGERDQIGFLRVDDPTNPRIGAGSRPFFDIGAFERRIIIPPKITDVTATFTDATAPGGINTVDFYAEGGVAGSNRSPRTLRIQFNRQLDPATINNRTILLEAAGFDGIFRNGNNSSDRFIDLAGKLSYNPATGIVTIDLSGVNPPLGSDLYRLTVLGSGADVVRDPQGVVLDGENTSGGSPTGTQLPIAAGSGDDIPGGNFYLFFSIDNLPPAVIANTVRLDPASDTGVSSSDNITNDNTPSFTGTATDQSSSTTPLANLVVYLDLAGPDKVFGTADDILNAGTATTNAQGQFTVTYGVDGANTGRLPANLPAGVPNTFGVQLGPDAKLGTADDILTSYSLARIRVADVAGNNSSTTDPNAQVRFVVDVGGPRLIASDPQPNMQATVTGNQINVALTFSETLNPATINSSTIRALRAGPDGQLGTTDDQPLTVSNISTPQVLPSGQQVVRFSIQGVSVNDVYRVVVSGTTPNALTDVAGNPTDGEFTGVFPSGNLTAGGDFNLDFVVFSPGFSRLVFVDDNSTAVTPTGRRNAPYPTVNAAIAAAGIGDIVAVLPGTYSEAVALRSYIRVFSADPTSSDSIFNPGQALQTVLLAPSGVTGQSIVVNGSNILSLPNLQTELAGFTIMTQVSGTILANSLGVNLFNSDVLIDKNYIISSGVGVHVTVNGISAGTPRIENNVIVGNTYGVVINDTGVQSFRNNQPVRFYNNTVALNDNGMLLLSAGSQPIVADLTNNIFASNFRIQSNGARTGTAIYAATSNRWTVRNNLFFNNGADSRSTVDDTAGIGGSFNPFVITATGDANGNLTGNPAFVNPRDPRPSPQGQGPNVFVLDANFDLTSNSSAIDNGLQSVAPVVDLRYRSRTDIANRGLPNRGPTDIGAFEHRGLFGIPALGFNGQVLVSTAAVTGGSTVNTLSASQTRSAVSASSVDRLLSDDFMNNGVASINGAYVSESNVATAVAASAETATSTPTTPSSTAVSPAKDETKAPLALVPVAQPTATPTSPAEARKAATKARRWANWTRFRRRG